MCDFPAPELVGTPIYARIDRGSTPLRPLFYAGLHSLFSVAAREFGRPVIMHVYGRDEL